MTSAELSQTNGEPEMVKLQFAKGENYAVCYMFEKTHLYVQNERASALDITRLEELARDLFPNEDMTKFLGIRQYESSLRIELPPLIEMNWGQRKNWIDKERKMLNLIKKIEGEIAA